MKRVLSAYALFTMVIVFLVCLNLVNYKEFKRLHTKYNSISTEKQREVDAKKQNELEKNKESNRKYGYSDILNFSSSIDGMKMLGIENNADGNPSAKVSFQYKGNRNGLLDVLSSLQKQENLISVTSVKIIYNKDDESLLGSINAVFVNNK